ncbi:hypothetical protein BC936DRAFT_145815 [Jimgerdemannia flammicorona]|uniref:Uncharacterized protein n=1 Tax=Jimgerdemannia flammicorona TaxID=994334 RepID=A0A433D957_9FUNG|nr:hypothetical protein BC936DRAFT_145815 [Jimgerdemannia flammicorona]
MRGFRFANPTPPNYLAPLVRCASFVSTSSGLLDNDGASCSIRQRVARSHQQPLTTGREDQQASAEAWGEELYELNVVIAVLYLVVVHRSFWTQLSFIHHPSFIVHHLSSILQVN